jgi:hypothetical protein
MPSSVGPTLTLTTPISSFSSSIGPTFVFELPSPTDSSSVGPTVSLATAGEIGPTVGPTVVLTTMEASIIEVNPRTFILRGKDSETGQGRFASSVESFGTWMSYNPEGNWADNTSYTGHQRMIGDTLESRVRILLSGAPDSAVLALNLPIGFTVDLTKFPLTTTKTPIGVTILRDDSAGIEYLAYTIYDGDIKVVPFSSSLTLGTAISETVPFTWESGDSLEIWYSLPVVR